MATLRNWTFSFALAGAQLLHAQTPSPQPQSVKTPFSVANRLLSATFDNPAGLQMASCLDNERYYEATDTKSRNNSWLMISQDKIALIAMDHLDMVSVREAQLFANDSRRAIIEILSTRDDTIRSGICGVDRHNFVERCIVTEPPVSASDIRLAVKDLTATTLCDAQPAKNLPKDQQKIMEKIRKSVVDELKEERGIFKSVEQALDKTIKKTRPTAPPAPIAMTAVTP